MGKILTSWKEIAAYLGKGVRTVQRWEVELELPVRRPNGKDRQIVMAFTDELDDWARGPRVKSSGARSEQLMRVHELTAGIAEQIAKLATITRELAGCIEKRPEICPILNSGVADVVEIGSRGNGRSASRVLVRRERSNGNGQLVDPAISGAM